VGASTPMVTSVAATMPIEWIDGFTWLFSLLVLRDALKSARSATDGVVS
jgi:hypothetical protein